MNKKLLKSLLIGTALTSVSFGGIAGALAEATEITIENYQSLKPNETAVVDKDTKDVSLDLKNGQAELAFTRIEPPAAQTFFLNTKEPIDIAAITVDTPGGLRINLAAAYLFTPIDEKWDKIGSVYASDKLLTIAFDKLDFTIDPGDSNRIGRIKFTGDVNADTAIDFTGPAGTDKSHVEFEGMGKVTSIINSNNTNSKLTSLENGNLTIDCKSEVNDYEVWDGGKMTMKNDAKGQVTFNDASSRLIFDGVNDNTTFTGNVSPEGEGMGIVEVKSDTTIIGNIGSRDESGTKSLNEINVADYKKLILQSQDTAYVSKLTLENAAKLDISGGGNVGEGITMEIKNATLNKSTIVMGNNSKIYGNVESTNYGITLDITAIDKRKTEDYVFNNYSYRTTDKLNITMSGNSKYIQYTFVHNGANTPVTLTTEIDIEQLNKDLTTDTYSGIEKEVFTALVHDIKDSDVDSLFTLITRAGQQSDFIASLVPTNKVPAATQIMTSITGSVNNYVDNLLQHRALKNGVAAADDMRSNASVWFKGFAGKGKQSASTNVTLDPYESSLWGGMGALESSNDNGAFGVAVSYAKTDLTYDTPGKKDEYKTLAGSFYGSACNCNGMLVNGSFTAAKSDINTSSNITSTSTGGSVMAGYKPKIDQFTVTPLVGVRFTNIHIPKHHDLNDTRQELKTDVRNVELALGGSMSKDINNGNMSMTPELHSFVYYNFNGTTTIRRISIAELSNTVSYSVKSDPMHWNLGGSLTTQSDMVEYSASVDANFSDAYWDVQGSLKVKVKL